MSTDLIFSILFNTVLLSSPLILAALGGLCSERSGVINIGLEGKMLGAACACGLVSQATNNALIGLGAGLLTAIALSALHAVLTQAYKIDHIISGMGINALAAGATSLVLKTFAELASTEMAGFKVAVYWILAWTSVVGVWWYIRSTKGGLRLLAVGNDPDKARQMGISPVAVRYQALLWTGIFCGFAGALIVTNGGSFGEQMTAGRGYIALAALIIGGWRAPQTLIACVVFGFFEALQLVFQGTTLMGTRIPPEFWQSLPYLVTILALAGMLGKNRAPAGLGRP